MVSGVILAGGRAVRMGGRDKGLVHWHGQELVRHVCSLFAVQVDALYVNANRNLRQYADLCGCEVVADDLSGFQGPLAGIAAVLRLLDDGYLAVLPCDAPHVPHDLVARLLAGIGSSDIAVAHDGARLQSLHLLLHVRALASLLDFMQSGKRKPDAWYARHGYVEVDFSDCPKAFANLNSLEDIMQNS